MVKKITELTPEQREQMPAWRDKWIEIGLKTGETDWDTFEQYIPLAYEKAGLQFPEKVVRVSSPMVGAFTASIANAILSSVDVSSAISDAIGDAVCGDVSDVIDKAIDGNVNSVIYDAICVDVSRNVSHAVIDAVNPVSLNVSNAIGDAVCGAVDVNDAVSNAVYKVVCGDVSDVIDKAIDGNVNSVIYDAICVDVGNTVSRNISSDAIDDAINRVVNNNVREVVDSVAYHDVRDMVCKAISDAVEGTVGIAVYRAIKRIQWHSWFGGQFWVGGWWGSPAFVSFFTDVCNLELDQDIMERATIYRKLCESANYFWCNSQFVIVCARPTEIYRNDRGELHNESGMAIKYPDGWGLYSINGFTVPEKVVMAPETITIQEIQEEENQEVRRIMIERYGVDKYLGEINAEIVDVDMRGVVGGGARALMREANGNQWLVCTDGSTDRVYYMFVPQEIKTCKEAHQTLCGFPERLIKAEG
jgi:hypothetical protein